MKAFWIFAGILTIVYIIYYVVNICLDLYRKPKDQPQKMTEEDFDLKGMQAPEEARAVEKTDGGFRVGQGSTEDGEQKWDETVVRPKEEPPVADTSSPAPVIDANGAKVTPAQQKVEEVKNQMEEADVQMSSEMARDMFLSAMKGGEDTTISKEMIPSTPGNNEGTNELRL